MDLCCDNTGRDGKYGRSIGLYRNYRPQREAVYNSMILPFATGILLGILVPV